MNLNQNTYNIKKELINLKNYLTPNKEELLEKRINERLKYALKTYYDQLTKSLDKLEIYNEYNSKKLIKKINKE